MSDLQATITATAIAALIVAIAGWPVWALLPGLVVEWWMDRP